METTEFGLDSTSRCRMVVWLRLRTVRDVSGAVSLAKNAAVRALETAPSIANASVAGSVMVSSTPCSTRTPRIVPLRSTIAMMASLLGVATDARPSNVETSLCESCGYPITMSSVTNPSASNAVVEENCGDWNAVAMPARSCGPE